MCENKCVQREERVFTLNEIADENFKTIESILKLINELDLSITGEYQVKQEQIEKPEFYPGLEQSLSKMLYHLRIVESKINYLYLIVGKLNE